MKLFTPYKKKIKKKKKKKKESIILWDKSVFAFSPS
jgi:hypothetical protein